ncbi:hypothetical protein [Brevibacterium sp.]|uniref:antitoxin VbhA family protein n=1 Tax=Brevibacterium sp. TaxID=1701 RepID=UPI003461F746
MAGIIHAPSRPLDLQAKWPELFEGMTAQQIWDVEQVVASSWHEGREPEREHTSLLAARVRGEISKDEYRSRSGLPPTQSC